MKKICDFEVGNNFAWAIASLTLSSGIVFVACAQDKTLAEILKNNNNSALVSWKGVLL